VRRRCVGFADDPVALTKGEVLELIDEFNQDLDYQLGRVHEAEQAYQGCATNEEKLLKEAGGQVRRLEKEVEFRVEEARKTASILNDRNFDIMGYKERIRVLEEANELLRHNRDRANDEVVRLTEENKGLRGMAQMWKEFHDQLLGMQNAFDEARKRMRS